MTQPVTDPLDRASTWIRQQQIVRPSTDAWFAGVCAGIAHRLGVDPLLIRAAFVVLTFLGGFGLAAYLILWLVLPGSDQRILGEEAVRRGSPSGIALAAILALVLVGGVGWSANGGWRGWILVPLGVLAWVLLRRNGSHATSPIAPPPAPGLTAGSDAMPDSIDTTHPRPPGGDAMSPTVTPELAARYAVSPPPQSSYAAPPGSSPHPGAPTPPLPPLVPPPPRPRRRRPSGFVGLISLGLAVTAYGVGHLIATNRGLDLYPTVAGLLAALVTTSLVALVLGLRGLAAGFTGALVALLIAITPMATVGVQIRDGQGGAGTRYWSPTTATNQVFRLGAGQATLDLVDMPQAATGSSPTVITVNAWAAEVRILVPEGLDVTVNATAPLGEISRADGSQVSGGSTQEVFGSSAAADVVVNARVSVGTIIIEQPGASL